MLRVTKMKNENEMTARLAIYYTPCHVNEIRVDKQYTDYFCTFYSGEHKYYFHLSDFPQNLKNLMLNECAKKSKWPNFCALFCLD